MLGHTESRRFTHTTQGSTIKLQEVASHLTEFLHGMHSMHHAVHAFSKCAGRGSRQPSADSSRGALRRASRFSRLFEQEELTFALAWQTASPDD